MKTILLTALLSLSFLTYGQNVSNVALYNVNFNNSETWGTDNGFLHVDGGEPISGYRIDKNADQTIINSSAFWFGGIGDSAKLKLCAQTYFIDADLRKGPYSSIDYYIDSFHGTIWKISKSQIDDHIANYTNQYYIIPDYIQEWPAHGNPNLGHSINLAPFVDVDSNGIYEPNKGDYPKIKGCQAIYIIATDDGIIHQSGGEKLGIEVHYMLYQLESSSPYDDVTFMDIKVIKRSSETINDFTMTYYVDGHIGNPMDDYVGSNQERNTMFFYNADNEDEAGQKPHYGVNPPAFGIVCLDDNVESAGHFRWGPDRPTVPVEFWHMMNAKDITGADWIDSNGDPSPHMFPGNPNIPSEPSAYSQSYEATSYNGIMTIKIGKFAQGDEISRTYAIVPATTGINHLDQVNVLFDRIDVIQSAFNNNNIYCGSTLAVSENAILDETIVLYPNPSNSRIHLKGLENGKNEITIVDILGKVHLETSIQNAETPIYVEQLPEGVYFVKVISESGKRFTLKMIKD